jgi:hypothetical protein
MDEFYFEAHPQRRVYIRRSHPSEPTIQKKDSAAGDFTLVVRFGFTGQDLVLPWPCPISLSNLDSADENDCRYLFGRMLKDDAKFRHAVLQAYTAAAARWGDPAPERWQWIANGGAPVDAAKAQSGAT